MQSNDLGIIIATSTFDWLFAKGTIASCRQFLPQIPIQLIVDGRIDTSRAEESFQVSVLRRDDIPCKDLREKSFGWGITKMVGFWYTCTPLFTYLDSDTIVWGNFLPKIDLNNYDFVSSECVRSKRTRAQVETFFFDVPFVEALFPEWNWERYSGHFFCTGAFAARKDSLSRDAYLELLNLKHQHPGKFKFGEMGLLNLMIFRAADSRELSVTSSAFQVIFPDHPRDELEGRFAFDTNGQPIVAPGDETILHMPDQKPLVDSQTCYSRPMTYFRLQYLEKTEGITGPEAMSRLRSEDAEYHRLRTQFLKQEKSRKIQNLLKLHPGEWRRLLSKFLKR